MANPATLPDYLAEDHIDGPGAVYQEIFVYDMDSLPGIAKDGRPMVCGFYCNVCGQCTDGGPCPQHAPVEVPGLRLVECWAQPRHWLFAHDAQDYGYPCPRCILDQYYEKERLARQCRHWPWRHWSLTSRMARAARALRIIRGYHWSHGDGHTGCVSFTVRKWRFR